MIASGRKRIGVFPAGHRRCRPRFLAALENLYPVTFEGRAPGELNDLDGAIILEGSPAVVDGMRSRAVPCLVVPQSEGHDMASRDGNPGSVTLSDSPLLDRRLRGRRLDDVHARHLTALAADCHGEVLASHEGWTFVGAGAS